MTCKASPHSPCSSASIKVVPKYCSHKYPSSITAHLDHRHRMLTLLFILSVTAKADEGLECIADCLFGAVPLGEDLRIRAAQCQSRVTRSACTVEISLNFDKMQYSALFGKSFEDYETITISSESPLDYHFGQHCSTDTGCVIRDAQKRIDNLIRRPYNATAVYRDIAPNITSSGARDWYLCYKADYRWFRCNDHQLCSIDYDPIARQVRSRGCISSNSARVSVAKRNTQASFAIECKGHFCNSDATYDTVKNILHKHNLVYANGTIIDSAGSQNVISPLSIMLSVTLAFFLSS